MNTPKYLRVVGGKTAPVAPEFTATFVEKLVLKRFIDFAMADVKWQFDKMSDERGLPRAQLQQAQDTAVMLSNYLQGLKGGIDQMVESPAIIA